MQVMQESFVFFPFLVDVGSLWFDSDSVSTAGEPGLSPVAAAPNRVRAQPHDAGRHANTGGPAAETAPPSGGGATQVS